MTSTSLLNSSFWQDFWRFSRPHTVIGTSLSIFTLFVMATRLTDTSLEITTTIAALGVWLACLAGNIYIVGLNQLEDIAIDKINKPQLPLAAGRFSYRTGKTIVILAGILALLLALYLGKWLFLTVTVSLLIGTAYSLPPLRLKRFPFLAALCILVVRGLVVNLGIFAHFTEILQGQAQVSLAVIYLTLFILFFSIGIALFKDVPDTLGDQAYEITTYTLILGRERIFRITIFLLAICYLGLVSAGISGVPYLNSFLLILANLFFLGLLIHRSQGVNLEQGDSISKFYQFIWKLFFLQYLLFSLASWLS
jgi:homogentisate phytyltransferase/homogentisate geranylgeranyltransferase